MESSLHVLSVEWNDLGNLIVTATSKMALQKMESDHHSFLGEVDFPCMANLLEIPSDARWIEAQNHNITNWLLDQRMNLANTCCLNGDDAVDGSEILHQLSLVVYPIIHGVLYIPGGDRRSSEPSTILQIWQTYVYATPWKWDSSVRDSSVLGP